MRFYIVAPAVIVTTVFYSFLSMIWMIVDRSGRLYGRAFRRWSRILLWLFGIRTTLQGIEKIDPIVNYVYLANHASYLDIITLGATIPYDIRFIFKRELARIPVFGWGLVRGPFILIDRSDARNAMASIEKAALEIRDGASVVIFPEGTRSHDGELGEFKRGGLMLATKSGVPMVPVAIHGTYRLMSRHDRVIRSGNVIVTIGEPILGQPELSRAEEAELQRAIHSQLQQMLGG